MYTKMMVGTDGSPTAAKAVDRAVEVARSHGATLTILSASTRDKGRRIVTEEATRHEASGVEIDTMVVDGEPTSAIVTAARRGGYDVLVVGNKGMTGMTRFFKLGAVPNKISHHLPCSLLIVKTT